MLYQIRNQDGMYPSEDGFDTVAAAAAFIRARCYTFGDPTYYIVLRMTDVTVAIWYDGKLFVTQE